MGYVKFDTRRDGFATQLTGGNAELVITGYDAPRDDLDALRRAGLTFTNYRPEKFAFVVEGMASIHDLSLSPLPVYAAESSTLHISQGMVGHTTPTFGENVRTHAREWQRREANEGKSHWEQFGRFAAGQVTTLYLSDLKNEIDRILGEHRSNERAFQARIASATEAANAFDFEGAESALAAAKELSLGTTDHNNQVRTAENLISRKKSEKRAEDKKVAEQEEKARKEQEREEAARAKETTDEATPAKEKASSSSASTADKRANEENREEKAPERTESQSDSRVRLAAQQITAGDNALRQGNYEAALRFYQNAQNMGYGYLVADRIKEAQAMSLASGVKQLIDAVPDPTDHSAVFLAEYSLQPDFIDAKFTLLNKAYWSDFFSFNIGIGATYRGFDGIARPEDYGHYKSISEIPTPPPGHFTVYEDIDFAYMTTEFGQVRADLLGPHAAFELALNIPIYKVAEISLGGFGGASALFNVSGKGQVYALNYGPFAEFSYGKLFLRYTDVHEHFYPGAHGVYLDKGYEEFSGRIIEDTNGLTLASHGGLSGVEKKLRYGRVGIGLRRRF